LKFLGDDAMKDKEFQNQLVLIRHDARKIHKETKEKLKKPYKNS